jgi:hypothetical protein
LLTVQLTIVAPVTLPCEVNCTWNTASALALLKAIVVLSEVVPSDAPFAAAGIAVPIVPVPEATVTPVTLRLLRYGTAIVKDAGGA